MQRLVSTTTAAPACKTSRLWVAGRPTHLLDLILQLSDTVHMSEFLQHVAALGDGRRRGR